MLPVNASLNTTGIVPVWIVYRTSLTVWTVLTLSMGTLHAISSASLIFSILLHRHAARLTASQILIVHLLFIEFLIGGGILPAMAITTGIPRFHLSTFSCQIFYEAITWLVQAEHWSAFFLSCNRITAILVHHRPSRLSSRRTVLAMTTLSWLIPCCTTMPQMLGLVGRFDANPPWNACGVVQAKASGRPLQLLVLTIGSYLPMAGTFTNYVVIFAALHLWRWRANDARGKRMLEKSRRRLRMAKMLFVSSLWFMAGYLPYTVTTIYFHRIYEAVPPMHLWMRLLYYAGLTGSPVIFFILSREYRVRVGLVATRLFQVSGPKMFSAAIIPLSNLTSSARPHRHVSHIPESLRPYIQ